jgi:CYTH domain-containing protein
VFIPAGQSLDAKLQAILSLLHPILDVEIERKFKLNSVPREVLETATSKEINQHYVMKDDRFVIRTRSYDKSVFELCIKGSGALKRMEWETKIPMELFDTMGANWPSVCKTRYYIPYDGHTLELDIYHGHLDGLITLECEFESEEASNKFMLPTWAKEALDVTNDPAYTNSAMACTV